MSIRPVAINPLAVCATPAHPSLENTLASAWFQLQKHMDANPDNEMAYKRGAGLLINYIEARRHEFPCVRNDYLPTSLLAIAAMCGLDPFLECLLTIPESSRPRTERISEPFYPFKSDAPRKSPEFVGETALHRAVKAGHLSTVKLLVLHGANLAWIGSRNAKDSCFRIAVAYGHWEICEYILNELTSMNFYGKRSQAYLQLLERAAPSGIVEKFLDRSLASSEKDWKEFSQEFFVNTVKWERWDLFSVMLDKIPQGRLRGFFGIPFFGNKNGEGVNAFFEKADKALFKKFVNVLNRAGILPWGVVLEELKAQNLECIEYVLNIFRQVFLIENYLKQREFIRFDLYAEQEISQWIDSILCNWSVFSCSVKLLLQSLQQSKSSLEYQEYVFAKLQYGILTALKKNPDVRLFLADVYPLLLKYSSPFISSKLLEVRVILPTLNAVNLLSPKGVTEVFEALKEKNPEFYLQFHSEELIHLVIDQYLPKDAAAIFSVFEKALDKENTAFISALVKKGLCTGEYPYLLRLIRQDLDPALILALIENESFLDMTENGALPLHGLCWQNQYALAFAILKKRPQQLLMPNQSGVTPFHFALSKFSENELKSCMEIADLTISQENHISILGILIQQGYSTCLPAQISEALWIELAKIDEENSLNLLEKMLGVLLKRVREGVSIEGYNVIADRLMQEGGIYLRFDIENPQPVYENTIIPTIYQLLNMSNLDSDLIFQCIQSNTDLCFSATIVNAVFVRGEERLIQCVLDSLQHETNLPRGLALYFKSDWTLFVTSIQKHLEKYKDSWITSNSAGKVPLQEAIEAGNGYFIEFYLKHLGYPQLPSEKGTKSPLLYAVKMHQLQSVQALKIFLASKDPNAFAVQDSQCKNILHLAASLPQTGILFDLLDTLDRAILGPLLKEKDKSGVCDTPLLTYFKNQIPVGAIDKKIVAKFQELGADFSVRNDDGESPIHWMLVLNGAPLELDFIKQAAFAAVQKFQLFASMPLEVLMKHLTWMNQGYGLRQGVAQRVALKEPLENALEWHTLTQTQNGDKWRVQNQREFIIQVTNLFAKYKNFNHSINRANQHYGLTLSKGHLDFIVRLEATLPDVSGIQIGKLLDLFDERVDDKTRLPSRQSVDPFENPVLAEPWTREQLRHNLGQLIERINTETPYTGTPPANTAALKAFYQIKRKILRQFIYLLTRPDKEGDDPYSRGDNIRTQLIELSTAADVCATRTLEELRNRRNEMLLLINENVTNKDRLHLELFTLRQQLFLEETRKITSVQGAQDVHNQYKIVHALGVEFGVISSDEITDDPTTQPLSAQEISAIRERMQNVYNPFKLLLEYKQFHRQKETILTQMIGPKEASALEIGLTEYALMYDTADVLRAFEEGEVIECTPLQTCDFYIPCHKTQLLAALYAYVLKPDNQEEIASLMDLLVPEGVGLSYLDGLTIDKVLALSPATIVGQLRCVKPSSVKRQFEEGYAKSFTLADLEEEQRRKGNRKAGEVPQFPKAAKTYVVMHNITGRPETAAAEAFQGRVSDTNLALEEPSPLEGRAVPGGARPMLRWVINRTGRLVLLPPNEREEED